MKTRVNVWFALTTLLLISLPSQVWAAAPTGLKAVPIAPDRIELSWGQSTSGLCVNVQRRLDNASWENIASGLCDQTYYEDQPHPSRERYFYQVCADEDPDDCSNVTWAIPVYTGAPLSSWVDVTAPLDGCPDVDPHDCNDDSLGIQCRLELLGETDPKFDPDDQPKNPAPAVLYFPDGTYLLSQTVFLEGKYGVSLIGQSMNGTIIKWIGPPGRIIKVLNSDSGAQGTHAEYSGDCGPGDLPACHFEVQAAVMFHDEGSLYSTFRNFTWDAGTDAEKPDADPASRYVVAFDESACGFCDSNDPDGCPPPSEYSLQCDGIAGNEQHPHLRRNIGYYDTGSAHFDSVFKNAWIGLRVGHYNVRNDEMTIRRCTFLNNDFGISIEDANALQEYIWDSKFEGNWVAGITNYIKDEYGDTAVGHSRDGDPSDWGGDFRVLRSRFVNNKTHDIFYSPTGHFTIRDNWSKGSGQFIYANGGGTRAPQTIIHNRVQLSQSPPPGVPLSDHAITILNAGAVILLDNEVDTSQRVTPSVPVYVSAGTDDQSSAPHSDVLSVGNKFTSAQAYDGPRTRVHAINDTLGSSLDAVNVPSLPAPLDDLDGHQVFTVTDGNNFQDVVDAARASGGSLVHLPSGSYDLTEPVSVGAGSDLHILGDGQRSWLYWHGSNGGTMMHVDATNASQLTIQDLWFGALRSDAAANGIVVENVDQKDSRVFVNRVRVRQPAGAEDYAGIDFDRLDQVRVDVMDSGVYGGDSRTDVGYRIRGGATQSFPMAVWTSGFFLNDNEIRVTNGQAGFRGLFSSIYMEQSRQFLRVEGGGGPVDVTLQGTKIATTGARGTNAVSIEDVPGNVSVVNTNHFDWDSESQILQGARIEHTSQKSEVDIELLGNTAWETPSHFEDPAASRVVDFAEARWHCKDGEPNPAPSTCQDGYYKLNDEEGSIPDDDPLVEKGLSLLRTPDDEHPDRPVMPPFYDEESQEGSPRINLDNVAMEFPLTGVLLRGDEHPAYFAPFNLQASSNGSKVTLSWRNSTQESPAYTTYLVLRASGPTPGEFTTVTETSPGETSYVDAPPSSEEHYYYKVVGRRGWDQSGASNVADGCLGPNAPTNLIATGVPGGPIVLTWTNNSSCQEKFHVYRALGATGNYDDLTPNGTANMLSYTDEVTEGTYFYKVRAWRSDPEPPHGYFSGDSNVASITLPVNMPTLVVAGAGTRPGVQVSWTDSSAMEYGYRIERRDGNGAWESLVDPAPYEIECPPGRDCYNDGSAVKNRTYTYRVRATSQAFGDSAYRESMPVTMPGMATSPNPADHATNVNRRQRACWVAGLNSSASDVYLGTDEAEVAGATRDTTGIYQAPSVFERWWDVPTPLSANQTYYWRIDSVSHGGITKGTVWAFTTGSDITEPMDCD